MTSMDTVAGAGEAQPDAVLEGVSASEIQGRSLGQIAWMRFKRDKFAVASIGVLVLVVIFACLADPINHLVGVNPDSDNVGLLNYNTTGLPTAQTAFGGISLAHPLGIEVGSGRDLLARIDVGARYSLIIALTSTFFSVLAGTVMGALAGYFGGKTDTVLSRIMDVMLAFPQILFALAIAAALEATPKFSGLWSHVGLLIFIIGFFSAPYFGRIIRGQVLSLRQKEFVEASRGLGASSLYIIRRELLPNLFGPILVYSTLIIPTNILFEAALSYLGVGIPLPSPSWGNLLSEASTNGNYTLDPMFMVVPGLAIFITVMAFNLFGDGLRDALDPRSNR